MCTDDDNSNNSVTSSTEGVLLSTRALFLTAIYYNEMLNSKKNIINR